MISTSLPPLFTKILLTFVTCTICSTNTHSSMLLSELFESCGIFLKNSQMTSNAQRDIIKQIIEQRMASVRVFETTEDFRESLLATQVHTSTVQLQV